MGDSNDLLLGLEASRQGLEALSTLPSALFGDVPPPDEATDEPFFAAAAPFILRGNGDVEVDSAERADLPEAGCFRAWRGLV